MLIAHLPSGYIFGSFARKLLPNKGRAVMAAALLGSFAPDFDMLYFHLIDARQINHHDYFTHWPLFWLMTGLILFALVRSTRPSLVPIVIVFSAATLMHMMLDSFAAPIHWLAPFADGKIELVEVPRSHSNWIISFMMHWTFVIEVIICFAAFAMFARQTMTTSSVSSKNNLAKTSLEKSSGM
ncbi:MAG: metal-dependent hydrolase [Rhizobiaceae bacterium]